ncbi:MAG: T9SS type A sorting domain-containing protein [Chitinophagaceae bacterium]|nr:T9SS type A sorting domain-containing protein [Chitinophagaceae bacterium]MCB9046207.1 T9SS type A sorting domain-containing protein [Chitinophagales bacterium]
MNDTLFITNRTDKPMLAIISDNYTGNDLVKCELQPGANKIHVTNLDNGTYYISLSDHNNDVIYKEKIVKN